MARWLRFLEWINILGTSDEPSPGDLIHGIFDDDFETSRGFNTLMRKRMNHYGFYLGKRGNRYYAYRLTGMEHAQNEVLDLKQFRRVFRDAARAYRDETGKRIRMTIVPQSVTVAQYLENIDEILDEESEFYKFIISQANQFE